MLKGSCGAFLGSAFQSRGLRTGHGRTALCTTPPPSHLALSISRCVSLFFWFFLVFVLFCFLRHLLFLHVGIKPFLFACVRPHARTQGGAGFKFVVKAKSLTNLELVSAAPVAVAAPPAPAPIADPSIITVSGLQGSPTFGGGGYPEIGKKGKKAARKEKAAKASAAAAGAAHGKQKGGRGGGKASRHQERDVSTFGTRGARSVSLCCQCEHCVSASTCCPCLHPCLRLRQL